MDQEQFQSFRLMSLDGWWCSFTGIEEDKVWWKSMSVSLGFVEFEVFETHKRKMSRGRWIYVCGMLQIWSLKKSSRDINV